MCDETTQVAADDAGTGLTRRRFAALSGVAAVAASSAGLGAAAAEINRAALHERIISVPTPNGMADAFFVYPAQGSHPGVVMWPDIAGLRDSFMVMGRRLAAAGYAVLVVNQYYRNARAPVLNTFAEWRTPQGQAKLAPMIAALTSAAVASDAGAFVQFLDTQPAVDKARRIGTNGYCMGGPSTVRTAAAAPMRVGAVASFHGASLVTEKPDSPHRLIAATHANLLLLIARGDDARAPGDKDALRAAATAAHRSAEIEVYPAEHGWCVLDSPVYDHAQAERAWGRLLAHFARL